MSKNKAAFLDKDGTIVDNSMYPQDIPRDYLMKDNIIDGLKYLQNKGYMLFIISNQPWISKNMMSVNEVESVFKSVVSQLGNEGIIINDYFYCPHQTSDQCNCKKPKTKFVDDASKKYDIDLSKSIVVGDMSADVLLGKNSGMRSFLVLTGLGKNVKNIESDYVIDDLNEINKFI